MKSIDRRAALSILACEALPGRDQIERFLLCRNTHRWDALERLLSPDFNFIHHGHPPLTRNAYIEQLQAQAALARDVLTIENYAASSAGFSASIITHRHALVDGVPGFDRKLRKGEEVRTIDFAFFDVTGDQITELRSTRMERAL